jgi:hypothetical protein
MGKQSRAKHALDLGFEIAVILTGNGPLGHVAKDRPIISGITFATNSKLYGPN